MTDGKEATFPITLWDLLPKPKPQPLRHPSPPTHQLNFTFTSPPLAHPSNNTPLIGQARYDQLVIDMKQRYNIRIRKWRNSTTGCAWQVIYEDGHVSQLIEAPYPRGPMSCAVFLHEVGHHAIGFHTYKPRCLEELKAWQWAFDTMKTRGFNITPRLTERFEDAIHYAITKAKRRGIKKLPPELEPYNNHIDLAVAS